MQQYTSQLFFFPKKSALQRWQKCLVWLCCTTLQEKSQRSIRKYSIYNKGFLFCLGKNKRIRILLFCRMKGNVFQWEQNRIFCNLKMNGNILFRLLWIPHLLSLLRVKSSTLFNCYFHKSHFKPVVAFATLYTCLISSGSYSRWRIRST